MAQMAPSRGLTCCCRRAVRFAWSQKPQQQQRSFISLNIGKVEKLDVPQSLPQQYWSQLPKRLRPDHVRKDINTLPAPISEKQICKDPISIIDKQQMSLLDPTGARFRLFDPKNPDGAKAGDILLATFKTGEPFSGVAMSIKWRGPHTTVLLRNQLTRVGTEMAIKIFSPLVQSMEIAQKATKRPRRARLYYLRKPKHDMGSVQKIVDEYLRRRSALMGGKTKGSGTGRQGGQRGGKKNR